MSEISDYDGALKRICTNAEIVQSYIKHARLPRSLEARLDYSSLRQAPSELISDKLIRRFSDSIWQIDYIGERGQLYVVIHIEFQSAVDKSMAIRMLSYSSLIYESLWNNKAIIFETGRLPTIIPTVLYTGKAPWTAPLEVRELLDDVAVDFQPSYRYTLIDERRLVERGEVDAESPAGALMMLRHAHEYAMIRDAERRIVSSKIYTSNRQAYDELAHAVGLHRLGREVSTMEQLTSVIDEIEQNRKISFAEGKAQGIAEGVAEGVAEGAGFVIKRLLKNGLSEHEICKLSGLTLKEIRTWAK